MATAQLSSEQRFLLDAVDWQTYLRFLRIFEDRHIRLTYDRGELEIMTLSDRHERNACWLARLIGALTAELNIPIASFGSTTFKRKKKKRGLEPDCCFYIRNEELVRLIDKLDLRRHPPPDLAIEVEISRSLLNRISIYAKLGIPEIWRYDGENLRVLVLGDDGKYRASDKSLSFPFLPLPEFEKFLQQFRKIDETSSVRSFQDWVREQAPGWGFNP